MRCDWTSLCFGLFVRQQATLKSSCWTLHKTFTWTSCSCFESGSSVTREGPHSERRSNMNRHRLEYPDFLSVMWVKLQKRSSLHPECQHLSGSSRFLPKCLLTWAQTEITGHYLLQINGWFYTTVSSLTTKLLFMCKIRGVPLRRGRHVAPLCCIRLVSLPARGSWSCVNIPVDRAPCRAVPFAPEAGACAKITFSHDPERNELHQQTHEHFSPSWSCDKERCHVPFLQQV